MRSEHTTRRQLRRELYAAKCIADGRSQAETARLLSTTQGTISKWLKHSPHLSTARPVFKPHVPGMGAEQMRRLLEEMDAMSAVAEARRTLTALAGESPLKIDAVYGTEPIIGRDTGFETRIAPYLSKLIGRSRSVGVAWDLGIKPPAITLPGFVRRERGGSRGPIRFVPLCGITASPAESPVKSSTVIALDFHRLVNHGFAQAECPLLDLNAIPMVHPGAGEARAGGPLRAGVPASPDVVRYIRETYPDYETIFGPMRASRRAASGLVHDVDMIFTGLGTAGEGTRATLETLYPRSGEYLPGIRFDGARLSKARLLEEIAVGDLGGVLLPRRGEPRSAEYARTVDALNDRLATLRPEHLLACSARAFAAARAGTRPAPPGVVAIVDGAHKREALEAAVALGYVSRLIIDERAVGAFAA